MPFSVINDAALFPEGPAFLDGKLYYAEYGGDRITVWDGVRNTTLWSEPGSGPAAAIAFAGGLAVTAYDAGALVLISMTGATLRRFERGEDGRPFVGPNDGIGDRRGGLYFTASGPWAREPIVGRVYHLGPGGGIRCLADHLHYANGIALSGDGRTLLVAESEASRVIAFTVGTDEALTDRRVFVRMSDLGEPPDAFPDGIKLGPDGNVHIGLLSAGRVIAVSPQGQWVRTLEVPCAGAPNLAFSSDGGTIYIMGVDDKANRPFPGKVHALRLAGAGSRPG